MRTHFDLLLTATIVAVARVGHAQSPPVARISEAEVVPRLAKSLDSLAALDQFSGVVLLARNDIPVFQRAYGMADREAARPNTLETAFNLGSINKVFTATAIRQLADAGKLDLDSSMARYWPEYPNQEVARRVTVRQLLEHRSGIAGNIFAVPAGGTRQTIRHNRDLLPLFVSDSLQFEPGTRQQYSNVGYVVLGMLVERVSGEDYYEYVHRHIYQPAGMTGTVHFAVDSLPRNTALGYTRGGRDAPAATPLHRNTDLLPGRGSAAGGGYSTAADLLRFVQALRANRVSGGPPAGFGIAGGAPGINSVLEGGLPGGYDLVVLGNLDPPAAQRVAALVRGWLGVKD